jgi:hypothetical protein
MEVGVNVDGKEITEGEAKWVREVVRAERGKWKLVREAEGDRRQKEAEGSGRKQKEAERCRRQKEAGGSRRRQKDVGGGGEAEGCRRRREVDLPHVRR